ncbi:MAG: MFS transporter [Alphaproteobacteria bacterium]|nr:MFS transporter [Alphaproteobacteria bacterium]
MGAAMSVATVELPERAAARVRRSAGWALVALSLSTLLSSLGTSIANVAMPTLAQAFGAPFQDVQWIVLAYLLATTALVVAVGRLGDIVGRRRLMTTGILVFTAASLLCGAAPTLGFLVAARVAQGLGAAVMMALAVALAGEAGSKAKAGSTLGLLGTMSAVGTALGPSLGGALIAGVGWRAIFLVNLPIGLAAAFLVRRHLPPDPSPGTADRPAFDKSGSLLLALTLVAYALAMTPGRDGFGPVDAGLLVAALLGATAFAIVERRSASPLVRLDLFRQPVLAAGFAANALVTTVVMATLVVGPFHLSGALALDAAQAGLAMSCGPLVAALAGVPAGRLVDRLGAARMVDAGLALMAIGASTLPLMPISLGVFGYVVPLAVVTAGYALFQAANGTAVMAQADPTQRGVVSGLLNLSRNLGLVTGASAMGAVFAAGAATSDVASADPAAIAAGMRAAFVVAAGLVAIAIAVTVASRR